MKASGADGADDAGTEQAMPSWLAGEDYGGVDPWGFVRGRVVAALVGLGLWWAAVPTRWVIWTLGSLLLLGYGLSFASGRISRTREDVGEFIYLNGSLVLSVAQFVSYVLLTVVVLRYGLSG